MTPESSGSSTATALRSRRDARSAVSTSAQTTVNSAAAAPGSCARRSSTSDTVCHSEVDGMVDDNARLDNLQTERAGSAHFSAATCNRSACFPRSKYVASGKTMSQRQDMDVNLPPLLALCDGSMLKGRSTVARNVRLLIMFLNFGTECE